MAKFMGSRLSNNLGRARRSRSCGFWRSLSEVIIRDEIRDSVVVDLSVVPGL